MTHRRTLEVNDLADIDLADPRVHAEHDLSGVWQRLRSEVPVYWHPETDRGAGFWVITRYSDVTAVYRDSAHFSSQRGNVLDTLLTGGDSASGRMLAVTDGQPHADLRAVVAKAFSARALAAMVRGIRGATRRLLEDALEKGDCDFARDVAANIPIAAVCDLLGVPLTDRNHILGLTSAALGSDHGVPTVVDTWAARNEILLYFCELAQSRRGTPHDDLVSLLVTSEVGGRSLSNDEVIFNCYSILLGGDETTRLSMIGGVLALAEHPGQWHAFRDGDVSVESAVEEVLRWTTPALHSGRTATADILLNGKLIEAGDIVTAWTASANYDERQFGQPDVLDLSRKPNKHLTFAYGPHFCLGSYLARAELGAVLAALRAMVAQIDTTGPQRRVYSNFLSGLCSLPVRLTPRCRMPAEVRAPR